MEDFPLHKFRDDLADENVAFLNAWRLIRWYTDTMIHTTFEIPAPEPGQGDRMQP